MIHRGNDPEKHVTIAMCYISPEGIVLGADSTASVALPEGGFHYFNHAQKLFEIGSSGTLGLLTWGLGGLGSVSYRSLVAELGDELVGAPAATVEEVAQRWASKVWSSYSTILAAEIARCQSLNAKPAFAPPPLIVPNARTEAEEQEFQQLYAGLVVGFCVAGYVPPSRSPIAFQMIFDPIAGAPAPMKCDGVAAFWGAPNMIQRLIFGVDPALRGSLISSGKWSGTDAELDGILGQHQLSHAILPIRDAVDFVHACIYSTIKALKFSSFAQICGGPIELAVITTDRPFRWVRHKLFDAAVSEGERS